MSGREVRRGGTVRDRIGDLAGPPVPEDAERVRFTVRDPGGMGCDTAVWILRALHRLDASVWVEHPEAGSLQAVARGRGTRGGRLLYARFDPGEELTVAATGPEAREALDAFLEMADVPPDERKALYRTRHAGRPRRSPRKRACRVCEHPETGPIDAALLEGRSPRSIRADHPGASRAEIAAHRDGCLAGTAKGED